jgi:hypothetical protein
MALVDGDPIDTMLAAAIETLAAYRGLSTRG